MTAPTYRPGDRVVGHGCSDRGRCGAVKKADRGVSVMLRWDGANKDERVYIEYLRPETADDVAAREHAKRMKQWREAEPKTTIAAVAYDSRWGHARDEVGALVRLAETPAGMRDAAHELMLLADWFEARPAKEGTKT